MWTIFKVLIDSCYITCFMFWLLVASHVGLAPQPGTETAPSLALEGLNPWTTKEVPAKFNHVKEDSLALSIFLMLCNLHHYVVPDISIIPKETCTL